MHSKLAVADPWKQMIGALKAATGISVTSDDPLIRAPEELGLRDSRLTQRYSGHMARVTLLERVSPTTVLIAWRDSTLGNYGGQIWRSGPAPHGGTCALSGLKILKGVYVFRPRAATPRPSNANEMILAAQIENAEAIDHITGDIL